MKSVVSAFAALVRRAPWTVVAVAIVLTGVFGFYAGRVVAASGNEGFAPEGPEISASERITEKFGEETAGSTLQMVIQSEGGGDVITVEGLRTAMATAAAIRGSDLGEFVTDDPGRPGVFHFMSLVEQVILDQGRSIESLTDDEVKQIFIEAIDQDGEADVPPEQASFITRLVSQDFDPESVTASAGMALAFVSPPPGDSEESFNAQVELESAAADDLAAIDTPLELRPFSFALLLTGTEDFTKEVGKLFGLAFAVIMLILVFVYWLPPGPRGSRWASIRRTLADMLLTLLAIVMAIGWMQGIGYLFEKAGIIDAFSSVTQIVPILLIGLGVDYAIHLSSRYREEIGAGETVDGAMTGAVKTVGVALVLATVTTVIGFLTNIFNPVPALKDFGILAAVGIFAAFVLMLTFVPAVRVIADRRAQAADSLPVGSLQGHGARLLPKIMERAALLSEHAAIPTLLIALTLGGLGYYGFTQLDTRFSFTDFLPADSPYIQTLDLLETEFGGGFGEQTQVLVEAGDDQPITGRVHNALVAANAGLTRVADVSVVETPTGDFANATSPISVLGQLLQSGSDTPAEVATAADAVGLRPDMTVADDADVTGLYAAVLSAVPEAAQVIHFEEGELDALLWDITTTAGEDVTDLGAGIDDVFSPVRDLGVTAVATSQNIIGDVVVTELTNSQSNSLFLTIIAAGVVLIINFAIESRRWFLGVITIAPVGLVVLWTYGLMYLSGIPFGPVTATLSALAIGIGVPFTIHIARRFQEDRAYYDDLDEAMRSTTRHTGGALAGSAFTTMAGFGVLITSSLVPFRQMGQVTAYAIGLALVASVLVLPSMLALWDRYHQRRGSVAVVSEAGPIAD